MRGALDLRNSGFLEQACSERWGVARCVVRSYLYMFKIDFSGRTWNLVWSAAAAGSSSSLWHIATSLRGNMATHVTILGNSLRLLNDNHFKRWLAMHFLKLFGDFSLERVASWPPYNCSLWNNCGSAIFVTADRQKTNRRYPIPKESKKSSKSGLAYGIS